MFGNTRNVLFEYHILQVEVANCLLAKKKKAINLLPLHMKIKKMEKFNLLLAPITLFLFLLCKVLITRNKKKIYFKAVIMTNHIQ